MDNEFENVETFETTEAFETTSSEGSIVPKLVTVGAGVIGVGAGLAWNKFGGKIKEHLAMRKENKKARQTQKHLDALVKLGWTPDQPEAESEPTTE